ncbi:unnamed protein product [Mytilus edulis]|uniref:YqaJ viral recombinase domain-containing protein n=1 Tax=Mytilus edulis TaxID=6550 RepID=A0A8S3SZS3_MYTED|nr:unnamed protein product [Mytilus edulis]
MELPLETDISERATEFLFKQIQDLPIPQSDLQDEQEEIVMETHGEHFLDTDISTELYELLPSVIQTLKNEGEMDSYVKFNRLLAGNKLPLKNIAFLLFKDVVSWYSLDDSHKMRYSPEVKQFWRVGLKLFKGRFLRFMSGMKNQGQDIQRHLNPEDSAINFAVPDRKSLDGSDISETLKNLTPRIFHEMIDMLHEHDQDQLQTYKICFDGKKLNAGVDGQKSGDINLWGYEGPPSLQKIENRYENDLKCISSLERAISTLDIRHITDLAYVPESCKDGITETGKNVLTVISERLSALRKVKQKKEISLEKIKKICTTPEMNAKYSYAISAIRTFIYRIGACIDRLLNLVDTLGYALSVINDVSFLYCRGKKCYLSEQQNYVCLTGIQNDTIKRDDVSTFDTTFIKQKSTAWKTIRSFAKVTGSTCFDALGLGGLKKQKEHFEYVFSGKEKTEPSPEVKKYMQHCTVNEINCVATLVSKVLPVFYPTQSYFEEGCKVDYLDNTFMLLVSPDGSLRSSCEFGGKKLCFAVEIKCPYPGNVYKPKVYYELPHYYVPQILSEMSVLETNCIIFLCYSLESTIVFEADFDSMLWDQIMSRLIQCYGKADSKCPTKLPSDLKEFQEKMKQYCKDNVRLIAEVPSVVAKTCGHDEVSSDKNDAKYNQHKSLQQISAESCTVSNLNKTVYEIMETVKEAYGLIRHIATEVVVYLISDLNRSHIPERQHSVPIGYAMKGYSMTTDVMRNMVNDILEKCYHGGLYVPVISFDGQWYTIAVRSANNEPLTILQLMKDVYKQARSIKKSDMLKHMKQINLVPKLSNREEVFELIDNQVEDKITILNGKELKTPIYTLWKKKETPYLLHTSSTVAALLFTNSTVENKEITEEHENSRTEFLDNLPENIAPLIENDILEQVTNELDISSHQVDNMFHTDISAELRTIFQDDDSHLLINEASAIQRHIENNSLNDESVENSIQSPKIQEKRTIEDEEFIKMLSALQTDSKVKKWESISLSEFKTIFKSIEEIRKHFYRVEIQVCMISITDFLKAQHIRFAVSWTKYKLSDLMFNLVNQPEVFMTRSRSMKKLYCLKTLCLMSISKFPKDVLNIVYAEHIYPTEELKWRNNMPFAQSTHIEGLNTNIQWYSKPEYVSNRFMHLFSLLDCLTSFINKCPNKMLQHWNRRSRHT